MCHSVHHRVNIIGKFFINSSPLSLFLSVLSAFSRGVPVFLSITSYRSRRVPSIDISSRLRNLRHETREIPYNWKNSRDMPLPLQVAEKEAGEGEGRRRRSNEECILFRECRDISTRGITIIVDDARMNNWWKSGRCDRDRYVDRIFMAGFFYKCWAYTDSVIKGFRRPPGRLLLSRQVRQSKRGKL